MAAERDFYEVLGITRQAGPDEVRAAHRKLVRKYHPDANKNSPDALKKFQEVQEAYDTLSDADKRRHYDAVGHAGFRNPAAATAGGYGDPLQGGYDGSGRVRVEDFGGGEFNPEQGGPVGDIFEQLFGQRGPFGRGKRPGSASARPQGPAPSGDVEYPVSLAFEDAARGTKLPIQIRRGNKTETIDVTVPPGVKTGSRVRVRGRGSPTAEGPGDLFIVVTVLDHPYFRRDGLDVIVDCPVTLYEACAGGRATVRTLDGEATVTIPPGTSSGAKLRLRGQGVARGDQRGDQLVTVKIVVPKNLTADELDAIKRVSDAHPTDVRGDVRRA